MKTFAIAAVALVALALIFHDVISDELLHLLIAPSSTRVIYLTPPSTQIQKHTQTISLYNGQTFTLHNSVWPKISFDSSYPINFVNGECRSGMSTSFTCTGYPNDAVFIDLRPKVPLDQATKNILTVTYSTR